MIGWGCTSSYVHRMAGHKIGENVGKPCATNDVPVQLIIQGAWLSSAQGKNRWQVASGDRVLHELVPRIPRVASHVLTCRHVQWCLRYDVWMFSRNGNSSCTTKHTKRFHDWWNISVGILELARVQSLKFCYYFPYWWCRLQHASEWTSWTVRPVRVLF